MTKNDYFNPDRFYLLIKKDIVQGYKTLFITLAAVIGASLFILLISSRGEGTAEVQQGLFLPFLWLGGLIFTGLAFREAHTTSLVHSWLMTPASQLEKFIQKLLMTTVIFILTLIAAFFTATALNSLVYILVFKHPVPLFNPFQRWVWINIGHYLIVQSIFFLGAVWFRKHNFIKTVLTINILQIALTLLIGGFAALVFRGPFREALRGNGSYLFQAGQILIQNFSRLNPAIIALLKVVYFGLLAPFFWLVSWFRMREIEVIDGV